MKLEEHRERPKALDGGHPRLYTRVMVGANGATMNMRRGLVTVLLLPLLAGCVASPGRSATPQRTAEFTDAAPVASPSLPGTPSTEPVVIDTSGTTAKVFLKVDRMSTTSWKGSVTGVGGSALIVTVRCRGTGSILVVPTAAKLAVWGANGSCRPAGPIGSSVAAMPSTPGGAVELQVTAPKGSEWALLVTEAPPGTLLD